MKNSRIAGIRELFGKKQAFNPLMVAFVSLSRTGLRSASGLRTDSETGTRSSLGSDRLRSATGTRLRTSLRSATGTGLGANSLRRTTETCLRTDSETGTRSSLRTNRLRRTTGTSLRANLRSATGLRTYLRSCLRPGLRTDSETAAGTLLCITSEALLASRTRSCAEALLASLSGLLASLSGLLASLTRSCAESLLATLTRSCAESLLATLTRSRAETLLATLTLSCAEALLASLSRSRAESLLASLTGSCAESLLATLTRSRAEPLLATLSLLRPRLGTHAEETALRSRLRTDLRSRLGTHAEETALRSHLRPRAEAGSGESLCVSDAGSSDACEKYPDNCESDDLVHSNLLMFCVMIRLVWWNRAGCPVPSVRTRFFC